MHTEHAPAAVRAVEPRDARDRVLNAAETLFMSHGYRGTSMSDIASSLSLQKASLYHHAPGGKAQLYSDVMLRHFARRKAAQAATLRAAPADYPARMHHIVLWLSQQRSLDVGRMLGADLPDLGTEMAERLSTEMREAVFLPLLAWVDAEIDRGALRASNSSTATGLMLSVTEMSSAISGASRPFAEAVDLSQQTVATEITELVLYGMQAAPRT
jgi:TetR/AcrR family transcriptional regulator, cholesterol catabolism regulator